MSPSPPLLDTLIANRARFLGYLAKRLGDPSLAEDVLQDALARSTERLSELRDEEALIGWFYRVLDNAILDQHRRSATKGRALEQLASEPESVEASPDDAPRPCKCVGKLAASLKPEYAKALQRMEVDEVAVKSFAEEEGLTRGTAAVRGFRAREALRSKVIATCGFCAANGCVDCSCTH